MRPFAFAVALSLLSCGEDDALQLRNCTLDVPSVPSSNCTVADEMRFVDGVLRRHYLFNEQLPELAFEDYESADELFWAMLADIQPRDRFSYVTTRSSEVGFFQEGKVLGWGFSMRVVDDTVRLVDVLGTEPGEPPSPASDLGLRRGDELVVINGRPVSEILAAKESVSRALGPSDPGTRAVVRVRSPAGEEREVTLVRDFHVFAPLPLHRILDVEGEKVGYLLLRSFIQPAEAPLREAFADFERQAVDTVVLDLRYNGGGLITVARLLGNLLAGRPARGQVLFRRVFNLNNFECLESDRLLPLDQSLSRFERLVAITLGDTASASEHVISGVAPFASVATVGLSTYGKPFGQHGFGFCGDRVLRPVTFQTVNQRFEGHYVDGIEPSCEVRDDVDGAFGDPNEGMLGVALHYLETGSCPVTKRARRPEPGRSLKNPERPEHLNLYF